MSPSSIAVAVRSKSKVPREWIEEGVEIREADYNDPVSKWAKILDGIEKVLIISGRPVPERAQQHKAIAQGAKQAGVQLIAYTSIVYADKNAHPLAKDHDETENFIKTLGVPYVFARNGWYVENYLAGLKGWTEHGLQMSAAGDGKISAAARQDYAEAGAAALTGNYENEVWELGGDTAFTMSELTQEVSKILGKEVTFQNMSQEAYAGAMMKAGSPEGFAKVLAVMDTATERDGALYVDSKTLSKVIGHPTRPWQEVLAEGIKRAQAIGAQGGH